MRQQPVDREQEGLLRKKKKALQKKALRKIFNVLWPGGCYGCVVIPCAMLCLVALFLTIEAFQKGFEPDKYFYLILCLGSGLAAVLWGIETLGRK